MNINLISNSYNRINNYPQFALKPQVTFGALKKITTDSVDKGESEFILFIRII